MKKNNRNFVSLIVLIVCIVIVVISSFFLGNDSCNHYYSSGDRKVDKLSTEYYLGPTINENNDKISNVEHFEFLNGKDISATPIGYYVIFQYKENDINCEVIIESIPMNSYDGDIESQNIYTYKKHEIYLRDFLDKVRNQTARESITIIGNFVCKVNVGLVSSNDVNFERYKEISLEFICELIDNYITNNN